MPSIVPLSDTAKDFGSVCFELLPCMNELERGLCGFGTCELPYERHGLRMVRANKVHNYNNLTAYKILFNAIVAGRVQSPAKHLSRVLFY